MLDGLSLALGKLREILGPQRTSQVFFLALLMLLAALAELTAVFSFVPFAALVAQPELLEEFTQLKAWGQSLGVHTEVRWLLLLGSVVVFLFLLSSVLRAVTHWACSQFAWKENERLSELLLKRYANRPFSWFLQRNSSDLTRDVVTEVGHLVEHLLMKLLIIFCRSLSALFIALGIFMANPGVALVSVVALGVTYGAIYKSLRSKLTKLGENRLRLTQNAQRVVSETFSSIKEAKSNSDQAGFIADHKVCLSELRKLMVFRDVTSEIPILLAEALAVLTILTVAIYFVATEGSSQTAISLSVLYLAATLRLTPLLQTVYANLVSVRFFLPVLDRLHWELSSAETARVEPCPISFEKNVSLSQVGFTYPGNERPSLRDVDLLIEKNSSIALVGPTGGGKTTLADLLAGLLMADQGTLSIDRSVAGPGELASWRERVGYVPQEIFLSDDTVCKNIALGVREQDVDQQKVESAAKIAKIHDFIVEHLENGYQTVLGERGISLSGGQRQRIGIARALYEDPDVLILDEATSALDNATEKAVMETVDRLSKQKTLVLIAHRLSTVRECDVIHVVRDGAIEASGSYEQLSQESETFRELL